MSTTALKAPADGFVSSFPETHFDAILVVSFGGPEGMDDVIPFLENVTRGRNVPRERLEEVAQHYELFGGVSPINAQNRALIAALRSELDAHGIELPIYFGNRNWDPFLADTLREMADDGVERALAFFTSAYSSYSGCRQYRENLFTAQQAVGPRAPEVVRTRMFFNHPGWIEANADHVRGALAQLPAGREPHVAFTAHSIPVAMARGLPLRGSAARVGAARRRGRRRDRYGARLPEPQRPAAACRGSSRTSSTTFATLAERGVTDVVISPIGFVSDHLEVLFDLDVEARDTAAELGLNLVRAASAGTHPAFVSDDPRADRGAPRPLEWAAAVGRFAASHDVCPVDCCLPGTGPPEPLGERCRALAVAIRSGRRAVFESRASSLGGPGAVGGQRRAAVRGKGTESNVRTQAIPSLSGRGVVEPCC